MTVSEHQPGQRIAYAHRFDQLRRCCTDRQHELLTTFPVSYRDLDEIMAEHGVDLDHTTLNRRVKKYAGAISDEAHLRKSPAGRSCRMDETYVKVKGDWTDLYRAIDKQGNLLDFMLSKRRDEAAATALFKIAIGNNGWPDKVVTDKSGSNMAALFNISCLLVMSGWCWLIAVRRTKYLYHFAAG